MPKTKQFSAELELGIAGEKLKLKLVLPADECPPEAMLPGLHELTNQVMATVERKVEKTSGYEISCKKGCGACCRQYVGISPPEARLIHAIVEGFPKEKRIAMKHRFKDAALRLQDSGLLDQAMNYDFDTKEDLIKMIRDYFELGIPCPFLEDESCSIHVQRPMVCREYLVTSSPEHCASLDKDKIWRIEPPVAVSNSFARMDGLSNVGAGRYLPLIMALEWVERFPDDMEHRPGSEWVKEFAAKLSENLQLESAESPPDQSPDKKQDSEQG